MGFSWDDYRTNKQKIHITLVRRLPNGTYQDVQKIIKIPSCQAAIQDHHIAAVLTTPDICRAIFSFLAPNPSAICARTCQAWFSPCTRAYQSWSGPNNRLSYRYVCSSVPLLKWARKNRYQWDGWSCLWMVVNGRLDCLIYAHENGCKLFDVIACSLAASNGHLGCLRYLHENDCFWDSDTCRKAADNGHLDCLRYAHENGCKWDKYTCNCAASNKHLDCLRYAHSRGCEWDGCHGCEKATLEGHAA